MSFVEKDRLLRCTILQFHVRTNLKHFRTLVMNSREALVVSANSRSIDGKGDPKNGISGKRASCSRINRPNFIVDRTAPSVGDRTLLSRLCWARISDLEQVYFQIQTSKFPSISQISTTKYSCMFKNLRNSDNIS